MIDARKESAETGILSPDYLENYAFSLLHCIWRNVKHGHYVLASHESMYFREDIAKNYFHIFALSDLEL